MSDFALPALIFDRQSNAPGKRLSLVLAIGMHVLLALFLFYGVRWQTHTVEAVQVELVRATPAVSQRLTPPPEPAPPVVKPEPRPEPKIEPKPEPKPTAKAPDIALKDKEKPKSEPKPETKSEPKPDRMKELLDRESAQLDRNKKLSALDKELADAKAAQNASAKNTALAAWLNVIRGNIRNRIALPPNVNGNPEAVFKVTQLPTGEVFKVVLTKSSGHAALDVAIERAILGSSPFPKIKPPELFERELELRVRPLENQ